MRQLIDAQNEIKDAREFLTSLKVDLYPDEVYCFTPKGEVITLPRDATPIDFAYAIHSEVGHHCAGAKVNSRIVPLRHKLKNGEVVEIITSKDASPSRDWLAFVKTPRARSRIKKWVNQKEREDAAELGRKLLEKEARKFKTSWKQVLNAGGLPRVLSDQGIPRIEDLYPEVGFGKIAPRQILAALFPDISPSLRGEGQAVAHRRCRPEGTRPRRIAYHRQGPGRPAGLPGEMLQPDPGRRSGRLHHTRQGYLRAHNLVPERLQLSGFGPPDGRGVDQRPRG